MDFNANKEVLAMAEILERSKELRRLILGAEIVIGIFAIASLLHAIRWW